MKRECQFCGFLYFNESVNNFYCSIQRDIAPGKCNIEDSQYDKAIILNEEIRESEESDFETDFDNDADKSRCNGKVVK